MSEFGDKIQALMDQVYSEWQKEENSGKGKWDVLNGFSEAHQIAVVFGNFNYQVENGGIEQWIYNGYFHDDAEKFTKYLEAGAELDNRFQTILDRVNQLNQYAQETGCDRYGDFYDTDDDGESGFIGDVINCNAFNTWYYGKCDGDDWLETVAGVIEKVTGSISDAEIKHEIALEIDMPSELMPDSGIGFSERDLYGYTYSEMYPLLKQRALELHDNDLCIYLLYPDGTEAMADSRKEIETFDGIFGIESSDWHRSPEYERMKAGFQKTGPSRDVDAVHGKSKVTENCPRPSVLEQLAAAKERAAERPPKRDSAKGRQDMEL